MSPLDMALWIVGAVISFSLAALGGHISSNRISLKTTFWVLGALGVVVAVGQGLRARDAQTELTKQLGRIENNTTGKRYAILRLAAWESSFKPALWKQGQEFAWNLGLSNTGNDIATNTFGAGKIVLMPDTSLDSQQNAVAEFRKFWTQTQSNTPKGMKGSSMAPSGEGGIWFTARGPVMTPRLIREIRRGKQTAFILSSTHYEDETGNWEQHTCSFLQVPLTTPPIQRLCGTYTDREKLQ
jgi:hypothetical protein